MIRRSEQTSEANPSALPGEPIETHEASGSLHAWLTDHCPSYRPNGGEQPIAVFVAGEQVAPEEWGALDCVSDIEIRPKARGFDPITIGVQNLNSRVEKLEGSDRVQDRSIDNHENRMNTGRADCEAFQEKADRQFEKIDDKLDTISESVAGIEALKMGSSAYEEMRQSYEMRRNIIVSPLFIVVVTPPLAASLLPLVDC